jgi:iron complex outermembrane receptor protein
MPALKPSVRPRRNLASVTHAFERVGMTLIVLWVSPLRGDAEKLQLLEPVVITATRAPSVGHPAAAFSVVDWNRLRLSEPTFTLDEPLRRVPGVFVQNSFNFSQDQRIAIRGFGTRSAFGVREIKVLVDGIPESSPDGQTQLDNLDLGSARRVEVLRGTASALYGNASGGVINVLTDEGGGRPYAEARLVAGAYGMRKYQIKTGGGIGAMDYALNGSWSVMDGYRQNSGTESRLVGGKLRYFFEEDADLTVVFNHLDSPWSGDAGGLTRTEVDADRRQARALNVTLDAGEKVRQGKLGLVYRKKLSAGDEIVLTKYSLFREFENKLPIMPAVGDGIVEFDRLGFGGGIQYVADRNWSIGSNQSVAGIDLATQSDERRRFANLAGARGGLGFEQVETVRSIGPFVRNEFRPISRVSVNAGIRYDNVRFESEDRFLVDGNDSGSKTFHQLSYSGGLDFEARTNLQMYANAGTAFQTPTTTELANPTGGGGFNLSLKPQSAVNYEIGLSSRTSPRVRVNLAMFLLRIENELIPFTSAGGRDFFRNAGRSERKGVELALELKLLPQLDWHLSYSAIDASYRDYITAAGNFSGNREPGIPAHQLFSELIWRDDSGCFGGLDVQFVDQFDLNDSNTEQNSSYTLVNLRLGYEMKFGRGKLTPVVGVNNLLNQRYSGQTRLNAFGGRFYEPAPRLTAFAGVTCRIDF